jgi:hypothetical protein
MHDGWCVDRKYFCVVFLSHCQLRWLAMF